MNCNQFQDVLDDLLVAEPDAGQRAAMHDHLKSCRQCATHDADAQKLLADIRIVDKLPTSPQLKERIMAAIADADVFRPRQPDANRARGTRALKFIVALAIAASVLIAVVSILPGRGEKGTNRLSAFSLLAEASAAEDSLFAGGQIVHLVSEIIVTPVNDKVLAQMRWLPLLSLDAKGQPRFAQLSLPAQVGKGYTVLDEAWYDPANRHFVRVLTTDGKPVFANSYDGANVYTLESAAGGQPQVVKQPVEKDFHAPKSPAEFLGFAAGLRSEFDDQRETLAKEIRTITLADGSTARVVKLAMPDSGAKQALDSYWEVTIRSDNHLLEKAEWIAQGESLLVIRCGKPKANESPSMGWDLSGLAKSAEKFAAPPQPHVNLGMIVPNQSVAEMVGRADFATYIFSKAPSWASDRQITDILDVVSPPHRMFLTTYRASDHRHVVLVQSHSYNTMLGPLVKLAKLVYTSPEGIKVWSTPQDTWLAQILLQSARGVINDPLQKELTGYVLETPAGTFPVLAVNGKLSDDELHALIDSFVPAK